MRRLGQRVLGAQKTFNGKGPKEEQVRKGRVARVECGQGGWHQMKVAWTQWLGCVDTKPWKPEGNSGLDSKWCQKLLKSCKQRHGMICLLFSKVCWQWEDGGCRGQWEEAGRPRKSVQFQPERMRTLAREGEQDSQGVL